MGAPLEFVADRPVVTPDEVVLLLGLGIHQHRGPLFVLDEGFRGQPLKVAQQPLIQPLCLRFVTLAVLVNESFPQFDVPGGTLGNSTFGVVTGTRSDNRQIQFALKYLF